MCSKRKCPVPKSGLHAFVPSKAAIVIPPTQAVFAGGPGMADTGIDPLTALEQWVEQGKAPNH
jgi:hypothetical protein